MGRSRGGKKKGGGGGGGAAAPASPATPDVPSPQTAEADPERSSAARPVPDPVPPPATEDAVAEKAEDHPQDPAAEAAAEQGTPSPGDEPPQLLTADEPPQPPGEPAAEGQGASPLPSPPPRPAASGQPAADGSPKRSSRRTAPPEATATATLQSTDAGVKMVDRSGAQIRLAGGTAAIMLTNGADCPVAWRVRVRRAAHYQVEPPHGLIPVGGQGYAHICRVGEDVAANAFRMDVCGMAEGTEPDFKKIKASDHWDMTVGPDLPYSPPPAPPLAESASPPDAPPPAGDAAPPSVSPAPPPPQQQQQQQQPDEQPEPPRVEPAAVQQGEHTELPAEQPSPPPSPQRQEPVHADPRRDTARACLRRRLEAGFAAFGVGPSEVDCYLDIFGALSDDEIVEVASYGWSAASLAASEAAMRDYQAASR